MTANASDKGGCSPDEQLAALSQDTSIVGKIRYELTRLKLGSAQLADANQRLADGTNAAPRRLGAAANGSITLDDGQKLLTSKLRELAAGTTRAKAGMRQVADGVAQIAPQTQTLIDGLSRASDFLKESSDGVANDLDAGFYVPKQAFQDPRLITAMSYLLSKDGRTARFVVLGDSTSFSAVAIDRLNAIVSATDAAKAGTSLESGRVEATGLAAGFRDLHHMVQRDFVIIAVCALVFIFAIMALLLRSLVAPLYMIVTITVSYLAALGISKLVWQDLLGVDVYWAVPSLAFVALVAVGSDYNMLFMARVRDESTLGLRSGLVKALASTGGVITTAGVVFAVTMLALAGESHAEYFAGRIHHWRRPAAGHIHRACSDRSSHRGTSRDQELVAQQAHCEQQTLRMANPVRYLSRERRERRGGMRAKPSRAILFSYGCSLRMQLRTRTVAKPIGSVHKSPTTWAGIGPCL